MGSLPELLLGSKGLASLAATAVGGCRAGAACECLGSLAAACGKEMETA